jgi:CheY-like chemotaxis protein
MKNELCNYSGSETLLLVDDDKKILTMLADMFCGFGYTILKARDGEEAVETYKNCNKIQLVLMDILMPRKDGITASAEIREHNPNAIIILMSGCCSDGTKEATLRDIVQKPFLPSKMIKMIRNHLDGNFCNYSEC